MGKKAFLPKALNQHGVWTDTVPCLCVNAYVCECVCLCVNAYVCECVCLCVNAYVCECV